MANNRINRYIGAIALGTVLTAIPGCTDTWDDHYYSEGSAASATHTLWEEIKDNPNYSRFADIVKRAKYYKDNTHPVEGYTYEDILDGGQVNTLWIPDNSALSEAEYQTWSQMLESGDIMDGFNVQQQFLGNHIALWRHNISEPGIDTVKMINGKNLTFDKTARTLEGLPLGGDGEYNIPTVNGVMHVLKGVAPFHYNFYEHLKYSKPQTKLGEYVVGKDTTYFMKDASVEGKPNEDGKPTYVDSVYYTTNRLFELTQYLPDEGQEKWAMAEHGFGARINNEDSVFVMLLPTDVAWNNAYTMLESSHQYGTKYDNKEKGDQGESETITIANPDSLKEMSIKMDMIKPLVFNIHKQPKISSDLWNTKTFKALKGEGAEYLLNTYGDTLRAVDTWKPSDLFSVDPIDMSNGLAYEVDSWNFPSQYYTPDVEVEVDYGMFYNTQSTKYKVGPGTKRYSFSNDTYKEVTSKYGEVGNNNFFHLDAPGASAAPKAEIKLFGNVASAYVPGAQVMSGKYDIQVVLVPRWYMEIANNPDAYYERYQDEEKVDSAARVNKYKLKATLTFNNGNKEKNTTLTSKATYDGKYVEAVTLYTDFEFPYSYKNMRHTYPTLYIEGTTSGKTDTKNGFVYDLVIDKIILKRKN